MRLKSSNKWLDMFLYLSLFLVNVILVCSVVKCAGNCYNSKVLEVLRKFYEKQGIKDFKIIESHKYGPDRLYVWRGRWGGWSLDIENKEGRDSIYIDDNYKITGYVQGWRKKEVPLYINNKSEFNIDDIIKDASGQLEDFFSVNLSDYEFFGYCDLVNEPEGKVMLSWRLKYEGEEALHYGYLIPSEYWGPSLRLKYNFCRHRIESFGKSDWPFIKVKKPLSMIDKDAAIKMAANSLSYIMKTEPNINIYKFELLSKIPYTVEKAIVLPRSKNFWEDWHDKAYEPEEKELIIAWVVEYELINRHAELIQYEESMLYGRLKVHVDAENGEVINGMPPMGYLQFPRGEEFNLEKIRKQYEKERMAVKTYDYQKYIKE